MGVQCRIILFAPNQYSAEIAAQAAFTRVSEIDAAVSDYRVDSDVALLAAAAGNGKFLPLRPDTSRLLDASSQLWSVTSGAFDPTVGPVTRLWRRARAQRTMPDQAARDIARAAVGFSKVEFRDEALGRACRLQPGMSLDFGAIAKCYAAEEAVKVLAAQGLPRCLVSLSGDVAAGDPPPGSEGWEVEMSSGQGATAEGTALLAHLCMSTAGDAEQVIEFGGQRYSHIIDPRLGWALTVRRSVTTISPCGWEADGCDTALCVLGQDHAEEVCSARPELAAIFFEPTADRQVRRQIFGSTQTLDRARITWR